MRNQIIAYIREKYHVEPEYPWQDSPMNATFKDKDMGKWFAILLQVKGEDLLVVKAKPDTILFLSGRSGYAPGYHMNKKHWLSVCVDGTLEFDEVLDRLDEAYDLVNNTPTKRIYEAVKKIPRGKVATYGQVAEMAGEKKMARAVGNALHKNPNPDEIPCYRVVNAKGELAGEFAFGGSGAQAKILEADGIKVVNSKVDLKQYGMTAEEIAAILNDEEAL